MKRKKLTYFFAFFFPFVLFINAQAKETIWSIGEQDEAHSEFISSDKDIIDYEVPPNWEEIHNWGGFPDALYDSNDTENNPREIRINFSYYLKEYNNPSLVFIVRPYPNIPHYLELYKGSYNGKGIPIERKIIDKKQFHPYRFPLGHIKKGHHEENRITIKSTGPTNNSILFDKVFLEQNDTDSDGDEIIDDDEGYEGDCYLDRDTICIPLWSYKPYKPSEIKRISLHIEKPGETASFLSDVKLLDQNSLSCPNWLLSDYYFPYGFLGFRIKEVGSQDKISLRVGYMDTLYPSASFYARQNSNEWKNIDFEFLDGNMVELSLYDGGAGDFDGEKDGNINTIIGLSYTRGLDAKIEKGSCFIKTSSL